VRPGGVAHVARFWTEGSALGLGLGIATAWSAGAIGSGVVVVVLTGLVVALAWALGALRARTARRLRDMSDKEERFERAVSGSNDGLWDWCLGSDEVYYSPRFKELLGYSGAEFPGVLSSWADALHPADREPTMEAVRRHLEEGAPYDVEYRCEKKDGAYGWFRARGRATRDGAGRPLRMAGSLTDIGEQKHAEAELKRFADDLIEAKAAMEEQAIELGAKSAELEQARASAEAANRAKSDFLANMSHEIRTPMTAILGYAELLADPTLGPDEVREHVATIRRNGEHLLTIINDILDLSKIEAGGMTVERLACNPWALVREVTQLLEPRAQAKGIRLESLWEGEVPAEMRTDPTRLRQILLNLAGNAIKFTETGGVRIIMSLDRRRPGEGAKVCFDVEDTGIGMSPEQLRGLFRPFTQADDSTTRRFGGTGLGLTISKRLAEIMGGCIEVASVEGEGSTFRLEIDAGDVESLKLTSEPRVKPEGSLRLGVAPASSVLEARVLLAEDGPDNQRLISFHLRRAGATVEIADNGRIAVDRALEADGDGRPFDVILMDMQMPVLDGYGATRELRSRGYLGMIIGLTAHAMPGDRERVIEAGCDDYMTKPIDRGVLIEACRRASERGRRARDAA